MNVRYRVELSQTERAELTALLSGGKHAARKLKRAQILLAADAGASDEEIARSVGVGGSTVYRTKRRFVLGNLEAALSEEPRPGASRKLTGKEEALLVATACSKPPAGPRPLDAGAVGGRTGQAHRARQPLARDRAPAVGRKRPQALAQGHVVHSAGRRRIRRPHGGCARPLCRSARSEAAGGLLRREPDPAHRRGAPADPGRSRASSSATTASTSAMERPTCSSSSTCIGPGARSKSPTAAPQSTSPPACANSLTFTFPRPSASGSCWTICRPTRAGALYQAFPAAKRDACCAGWSSTMSPSTPAG